MLKNYQSWKTGPLLLMHPSLINTPLLKRPRSLKPLAQHATCSCLLNAVKRHWWGFRWGEAAGWTYGYYVVPQENFRVPSLYAKHSPWDRHMLGCQEIGRSNITTSGYSLRSISYPDYSVPAGVDHLYEDYDSQQLQWGPISRILPWKRVFSITSDLTWFHIKVDVVIAKRYPGDSNCYSESWQSD